jgi:hypothetical protein
MPFMDEPPGSKASTTASGIYGGVIRALRSITMGSLDKEPKWRRKGSELRTGYDKPYLTRPGETSTMRKARMQDAKVTVRGEGHPEYSGKSLTGRGEDLRKQGPEPGRYGTKPARKGDRPSGKSTARDSTGIDPQDPIDNRMPNLRP